MKFLTLLFILTAPLLAQQLVLPTELSPAQQRAFKRITEGVSAPCCSNAIPVAYHESGMAVYVRDFVAEKLGQGLSEKEVMKAVMDLRLGPDKLPVISATPEVKGLGLVAWTAPFILVLLMVGFILSRSHRSSHEVVDEKDLIELYRPAILKQLASNGGKKLTEKIETETHHNQGLTSSAAERYASPAREKSGKKVIALRLDERETAAFAFLGGLSGLKALLCPEGLCIRCRSQESLQGTRWDSFCGNCDPPDPSP